MILKVITIALLAVFVLEAHTQQTPQAFVNEADQILRTTFDKCVEKANQITEYVKASLDQKLATISDLESCGHSLEDISRRAHEYNLNGVSDPTTKQAILQLGNVETALKVGSRINDIGTTLNEMDAAFDQQNIEYYDDDQTISLKDIERIGVMRTSDSVDELNYYWKAISDKVGDVAPESFFNFVKVMRRTAKVYNLTATEFWFPNYSEATMNELEQVTLQLKPFYEELHGYIRSKILRKYGAGVVKPNGPIPLHLYQQIVANLWRVSDTDIYYFDDDFPQHELMGCAGLFSGTNFKQDAQKILEIAEMFYQSLGFQGFTQEFWEKNIAKSSETTVQCQAKVHDTLPDKISLNYCDSCGFSEFGNAHEQLGRIHSAQLKQQLPLYFYDNNVLGEAFGGAVKLSASSAKHFNTIQMAKDFGFTDEIKTNTNFHAAIETMFKLTEEYIDARLITDFLSGTVKRKQINRHYWKLWEDYAGVEPPVDRNEDSFDLPYTLITDVMRNKNLIRNFENSILSFQFYKAACQRANHMGTLSDCDFYNNKAVGEVFKNILSLGSSKPFDEVIAPILPNKKLDADGVLAYFEPTILWLKNYNQAHQVPTGWVHTTKQTFKELFRSERDALLFIQSASEKIYTHLNQINEDLFLDKNHNPEVEDDMDTLFWKISKSAVAAADLKDISLTAKRISGANFKDKSLKRALKNLARIGDLFVLGGDIASLLYNKGQLYNTSIDKDIPKYLSTSGETVALYPDIRNVQAHSRNEDELKYYWGAWRDSNSLWARSLLVDMFTSFGHAASILEISVGEFWFKHYSTTFLEKMERVIMNLRPLYNSVHYFVKSRLVERYGAGILSKPNGAIPDHLIEQMLVQIWTPESIIEGDFKFGDLPPHDTFVANKHYSSLEWLKIADNFYESMGFKPLGDDFWNQRLKAQPGSATATNCHATIFDMTPKTYMKYCDKVSYRKLLQAHGYMGRLHYANEKSELPAYFFDSFFLEYPVGEAVVLSASTPKHSKAIGLFQDFPVTDQVLLNRQLRMAIHTLFNLHRYFVNTKVMMDYLEGDITAEEIGKYYWRYMVKYAGIEPPVNRGEDDFDFPYEFYTDLEQNHQVKKFVSEVLGYQMYETLCALSGHQGDLNNCDFYGSVTAGDALRNMMKMGSTSPRKVILKALLPDNGMSAKALLHYYQPLMDWFTAHNIPNDQTFSDTLRTYKG